MVVVEKVDGDTFKLQHTTQNTDKAQNFANSSVCDPPVTPNIIYNHKVKRKNSLSSYSSVEIHRIRNQDPNLLNRPAWTDARIALLQIKKVIFICVSDRFSSHSSPNNIILELNIIL